jgi:H+/Cl- antiporter ClcA
MMQKADFTADMRLLLLTAIAIVIGAVCTVLAVVLLWLIAVFTNLFFYQQLTAVARTPAAAGLGWPVIFIPALGGLVIGFIARYGSERIRGHGIPEAIEAILIGRSRMQARVAILKPLSSAIAIGSGGPFGAEGPIIMTGGACGSLIAQLFQLTAAERKTLLVAGAAGGMTATFSTPLASVLLAVELLLFEWKPRSLVPVTVASAVAFVLRPFLLEAGPVFPVPPHAALHPTAYLSSAVLGLLIGGLALALTLAVYGMEDLFQYLPCHWMWWPAIGGLVIGIGGYYQPRALGVGYDVIADLLTGKYVVAALVPLILVKFVIWSAALGSGTSGGVLAPLLMMGGALGAIATVALPGGDRALWPLVAMAAVLGGTMRSPLTGTVFALELTHDLNALPALLISSIVAYGFTVLVMKRSILTEKVARRGYHISREYEVDPLERLGIGDVMTTDVITIPASLPVADVLEQFFLSEGAPKHQGYPVVDHAGHLVGMITRRDLLQEWLAAALAGSEAQHFAPLIAFDLVNHEPIIAYAWESCTAAAERMAQMSVGRLPVVASEGAPQLIGIITRSDLLKPRARHVEEEMRRERLAVRGKNGE